MLAAPGAAAPASAPGSLPDVVDAPVMFDAPLPATEPVDEDWFLDAVFIGDSRTEGLRLYSTLTSGLWLTHAGLNVKTVQSMEFDVGREKMSLRQALQGGTWGKVYLLLGVNEASWMKEADFYSGYCALIDELRDILPEAAIYIQTLAPVTQRREAKRGPDNAVLVQRNEALLRLCREKQVYLVDVAAALTGPEGDLPEEWSTDGLHFTTEAHHRWIDCLRRHTVGT